MTDRKQLNTVLKAMRDAALGKSYDYRLCRTQGICHNLEIFSSYAFTCQAIRPYYEKWPKWSGCMVFPVPSSNDTIGEQNAAMNEYMCAKDEWETTEYGQLRMELLRHLIRCTR